MAFDDIGNSCCLYIIKKISFFNLNSCSRTYPNICFTKSSRISRKLMPLHSVSFRRTVNSHSTLTNTTALRMMKLEYKSNTLAFARVIACIPDQNGDPKCNSVN